MLINGIDVGDINPYPRQSTGHPSGQGPGDRWWFTQTVSFTAAGVLNAGGNTITVNAIPFDGLFCHPSDAGTYDDFVLKQVFIFYKDDPLT